MGAGCDNLLKFSGDERGIKLYSISLRKEFSFASTQTSEHGDLLGHLTLGTALYIF